MYWNGMVNNKVTKELSDVLVWYVKVMDCSSVFLLLVVYIESGTNTSLSSYYLNKSFYIYVELIAIGSSTAHLHRSLKIWSTQH